MVPILGLASAAAQAADATPPPSMGFTINGVCAVQDYTPSDVLAADGSRILDPWGIWHTGIIINLGIVPAPGWRLLISDQLHVSARTDAGEILSSDPHPGRQVTDLETFSNVEWQLFQATSQFQRPCVNVALLAPVKPAARLTTVQGSLHVVVGDSQHLAHLHILPTADPRSLSEVPDCDLTIATTVNHQLVFSFTPGTLKRIHDFQFLHADGSLAQINSTTGEGSANHYSETLSFTGPPADAVQVNYYGQLKAFAVDFTLVDLPLVGKADAALLNRTATAMTEIPLPLLAPQRAHLRPALHAVTPVAPAAPSKPAPSF